MNDDVKISELPVATAIASPDVAPIVQGGVTKQADVSLFGSFLSHATARVDPSGNDGTGTVGDLGKPFLTVQATINAVAALDPAPAYVTIQVGINHFAEDVTISFRSPKIVFEGVSAGKSQPFDSLTFGTADGATEAYFYNCSVGTITQAGNTQITIGLFASVLRGDITGDHIYVKAYSGSWADSITIFGTSDASIDVRGLGWDALDEEIFPSIVGHRFSVSTPTVNGNSVLLYKSIAWDVTTNSLQTIDSIIQDNAFVTTTLIMDNWFDPSRFDFSTLPTSLPDITGAAWIDTTGGLNIIKVKL